MKDNRLTIMLLCLIIGLVVNYPEIPHISLNFKLIWISCSFLVGLVLPFFIYTASFSNKSVYSNEPDENDCRYIKPKQMSLFFGQILFSLGLGTLINNSFDLLTITLIFIGIGAIIGKFLYPTKKTFGNKGCS